MLYKTLPHAPFRVRLDSIKLCIKVTKEEQASTSANPPSFITLIGHVPFTDTNAEYICILASPPEPPSQDQIVDPSGLSHDIVGYRRLISPDEMLEVRDLYVPDSLHNKNESLLFKIDVKTDESPRSKFLNEQSLWNRLIYSAQRVSDQLWLLVPFSLYAFFIFLLLYLGGDGQSLYLAIWTLIFMPMIYEIRRDRVGAFRAPGSLEIPRLLVVFIGVGVSIYPAMQPIVGWPKFPGPGNYPNSTVQ